MGVPTPGQISYCPFLEVKGLRHSVPLLLELEIASSRSSYSSSLHPFNLEDIIILLHSFGRILMIFLL